MDTQIRGAIDSPKNNEFIMEAFNLKGWAYTNSVELLKINIYIDDELIESGICEFPRFDVYQKYSDEDAYLSGFMGRLISRDLSKGEHTLEVIAENSAGSISLGRVRIFKRNINPLTRLLQYLTTDEIPILGGVGSAMGNARKISDKFLQEFISLGKLRPEHKVLDIGCGVGRMAMPLTRYLTAQGSYAGTDNVKTSVEYANEHISARYPNFRFYHTDIYSELYNPKGKYQASDFQFDFKNESFDFIFMTSVFTHMKHHDVKQYLNEIARMLVRGGRCFITYFILNDVTRENIDKGESSRTFKFKFQGYWADYEKLPERAIAYEEEILRKLYGDAGLTIENPIHIGKWSGSKGFTQQDIVVAVKE